LGWRAGHMPGRLRAGVMVGLWQRLTFA
jgi:hypothetical protein